MPAIIGYHWVKSGHGLWLPGDERGHWSEAWDEELGFIEPHMLHEGDPIRLRMAQERMLHPPLRLTAEMLTIVEETLDKCQRISDWSIRAASLEPTHIHVLFTRTENNIDNTLKWLAQETTKAIHERTDYAGPVWCKGRWREFVSDDTHWHNTVDYIERHNIRRGVGKRPYSFFR